MDKITLNAHAKINLSLEITGKRPDGYHDIVSFMQGLGLHDVLSIEKCTQKATKYNLPHCTVNGIVVYLCTDAKTIPTDMDNLAFRAVKVFTDALGESEYEYFGLTDTLLIDIRKDLPVSAGIGGGSANAAACLLGLNEMTGRPFTLRELMRIGGTFGADVPFLRSAALATDTASTWDAVREALCRYAELGKTFDTMMLMQPTTPLRTGEDVKGAYALLKEKQAKSIIAVCEVDHSPLWCDTIPDSGSMKGFGHKELAWVNRQDLRPYYRVNGAMYLLSVNGVDIPPDDDIYEDNCYAFVMDRKKSVDIDSEDDLAMAEFLLSRRKNG